MKTQEIISKLQAKYPGENEYLQAVQEVLESVEEVYNQHPEFERAKIVERMVEPDRIFTFRDRKSTRLTPVTLNRREDG